MDLVDLLTAVADPRDQRWVEHPLAAVLALCAGAVVAGMKSFTAIAGWVADTPPRLLRQVYDRCGKPAVVPSKGTIWQVVTNADAAAVDAVVGAWLAARAGIDVALDAPAEPTGSPDAPQANGLAEATGQRAPRVLLAVDGKRIRGALDADGNAPHLLAAATHQQGLVLAQIDVQVLGDDVGVAQGRVVRPGADPSRGPTRHEGDIGNGTRVEQSIDQD